MDCTLTVCPLTTREGRALLLAHSAEALDGANGEAMALHLRACGDCATIYAEQAAVWKALDLFEVPEVSADFNRTLYQRIEQASQRSFRKRLVRFVSECFARPALPLALASGLLIAGFLVDHRFQTVSPASGTAVNHTAPAASATSLGIDAGQVNKALDDLQLLRQLDQDDAEKPAGKL